MSQKTFIFTVGCDLSDGRRFEAGQEVPEDVSKKDLKALQEMNVITEKSEIKEVE